MGFWIEQRPDGIWEYGSFHSAYGCVSGEAETLAEAKVELAIGEASVLEQPFPPAVKRVMRADYETFAKDWPDPPYEGAMAPPSKLDPERRSRWDA